MKVKEFEEITDLSMDKLYTLLMTCGWELLNAYAITGREHYSREAKNLSVIYNRLGKYLYSKKSN